MAARKHTITDASDAIGAGGGTLSRVLDGKRGVGMDLAAKIAKAYPEVYVGSWAEEPRSGEAMADVPRGRAPRQEAAS